MNDQIQKQLSEAAILTFEQLGFMFPLPERRNSFRSEFTAAARVRFSGAFGGTVAVAAYGGLLPALAANMLGEDDPPSAIQQRDALGEVTNVICGNLLPRMAGPEAIFGFETANSTAVIDSPAVALASRV